METVEPIKGNFVHIQLDRKGVAILGVVSLVASALLFRKGYRELKAAQNG